MDYQISKGNSIAIVSTVGGELISFINNGIEYIWSGKPEYWSGHAPVLFPTVGALKRRETEINGTIYQMKKHGFARKSEFTLLNLSNDSVTFSLKSNDETKTSYPFDFELQITHTIYNKSIKTEFKVINTDKDDILFGIGGHTGFNCPLTPDTDFTDYFIQYEQVEHGPFYYTKTEDSDGVIYRDDRILKLEDKDKLNLDYSLFDRDVIVMDNMKSSAFKLLNYKNNNGIEFKMNGFSSVGFWTPPFKKAPFICIEPWTVNPDFSDNSGKFNEKPNITKLTPNDELSVSYEIVIL